MDRRKLELLKGGPNGSCCPRTNIHAPTVCQHQKNRWPWHEYQNGRSHKINTKMRSSIYKYNLGMAGIVSFEESHFLPG